MLKFVNMNTSQTNGIISLNDSIVEVEGWGDAHYQNQFNDLLEQQPFIMGSLMDSDEGLEESTHSWVLKAVLVLKWSFQKMGWRMTTLPEEKWHAIIEEKDKVYDECLKDTDVLPVGEIVKHNSSPLTLSELYLYVVDNTPNDELSKAHVLFLLDCALEAMEAAVLQDKKELDT
jgi:hypothetical protein